MAAWKEVPTQHFPSSALLARTSASTGLKNFLGNMDGSPPKNFKGKNGGSTVLYPPHMSSCSRESKNYGDLNEQNLSTPFYSSDENLASPTPPTNASGLGALCQRQDKEMK